MTVQDQLGGSVRSAGQSTVELYDFQRPATLAREQSRALEFAFETFARQWGTQLTAKVRVISRVTFDGLEMATYDEYATSLPSTSAMVLCTVADGAARAVLQFPISSALGWVGRMLGGNGTLPVPERKFTPIEQAIVRRLMDDALEDLQYSMGAILPAALAVETIHYNSQFAQAAATTDFMIVARLTVQVGEQIGAATVAIPADMILPQLGAPASAIQLKTPAVLVREQLASVPVEVALQLLATAISPSVVLNLVVGQLLTLNHPQHRPLNLTVDGQTIARAAVGVNGSHLACVVVETQEAPA